MDDLEDTFQNVDQIENGVDKTNSHQRVESLLSSGLTFPEGIAIDWISRNIYYTGDWCGISSNDDQGNCKRLLHQFETNRPWSRSDRSGESGRWNAASAACRRSGDDDGDYHDDNDDDVDGDNGDDLWWWWQWWWQFITYFLGSSKVSSWNSSSSGHWEGVLVRLG